MSYRRPADVPDDVLLIHYAELAENGSAHTRLRVLAAIGRLFALGETDCSLQDLCQEEDSLLSLSRWIEGNEGSRFWQLEKTQIVPLRPCEKHILVGTRQLLDDLSTLMTQPRRSRSVDLDILWQAADVFIDQQRAETE